MCPLSRSSWNGSLLSYKETTWIMMILLISYSSNYINYCVKIEFTKYRLQKWGGVLQCCKDIFLSFIGSFFLQIADTIIFFFKDSSSFINWQLVMVLHLLSESFPCLNHLWSDPFFMTTRSKLILERPGFCNLIVVDLVL